MHQPRDLGEAFARAQQAQYFDLARCQFRKTIFGKSRTGECDAFGDRSGQEHPAVADLANGFEQYRLGRRISKRSPLAPASMARAANMGSSFMLNTMMRAVSSWARILRASSKPETPGKLMSTMQTSGRSATKAFSPLSASGVSTIVTSGVPASNARQPEATIG